MKARPLEAEAAAEPQQQAEAVVRAQRLAEAEARAEGPEAEEELRPLEAAVVAASKARLPAGAGAEVCQ